MSHETEKPSIQYLGEDLLHLSPLALGATLVPPFLFFTLYFVCAFQGYWALAVFCTVALSYTSYGSTSHDLVHMNLRLPKLLNEVLLSMLELVCFRSGHAYRFSHLQHHRLYPHEDDIEGAASRMSLFRTILEGIVFQFKIYFWALKAAKKPSHIRWIKTEGILIVVCTALCLFSAFFTPIFCVYWMLMILGSWIIPFITSYLVHTPDGADELHQTKLFRGRFFSLISLEHLTIWSTTCIRWSHTKTGPNWPNDSMASSCNNG